jgi:alpha-galactosidase
VSKGYQYINLDDCWMAMNRSADGQLVPDPVKFPRGIKYLADYAHDRDLKFGIYICAGLTTCAKYPGTYRKWDIDAQTLAKWG